MSGGNGVSVTCEGQIQYTVAESVERRAPVQKARVQVGTTAVITLDAAML